MRYFLWLIMGVVGGGLATLKVKASRWVLLLYFMLRLLGMYWVIVCCGEVEVDLQGWYEHAHRMLSGEIPCLDFRTPYGILFNGLIFLSVGIYDSPFAIVVSFTIFEMFGLLFFIKAMDMNERLCAKKDALIWLYITAPFVLSYLCRWTQDEGVLLFFVALLFWLVSKKLYTWIPVCIVAGVLFTKLLAVFFFAPFFIHHEMRKACLLTLMMLAIVWSAEFVLGFNPFSLQFERIDSIDQIASMVSTGNIWYGLRYFTGNIPFAVPEIVFVLLCILLLCYAMTTENSEINDISIVSISISGIGILLLCFYKMMSGTYFTPVLLPFLVLVLAESRWSRTWIIVLPVCQILFLRPFYYRFISNFEFAGLVQTCVDVPLCVVALCWIVYMLHNKGARMSKIASRIRLYFSYGG